MPRLCVARLSPQTTFGKGLVMRIIATVRNPLPIRLRQYDWVAFYDDDPEAGLAFAETERGAIDELTKLYPYNAENV